MGYVVLCIFGLVGLLCMEMKRVASKGKPQLKSWAEQNRYQNLTCSFQDCSYVKNGFGRFRLRPAYNFSVQEHSGRWLHGHAVCDLFTGKVAVEWHIRVEWDRQWTPNELDISDAGLTLAWDTEEQFAWLPAQTTAKLSDGIFFLDFHIDSIVSRQIGVGFLIDPPDWGFYGYLGAGRNAWSYDAFEGAIVTQEAAIYSNLPKIEESGTITMYLDLKRENKCVFFVNSVETPPIPLPPNSIVIPAACLLKQGQKVTLANFEQIE